MYKTIDENAEQEKYNQIADKITPEMLGLKPTNDFAQYAQQTIIDENPDKVKNWVNQGAIGVMEAGERFAYEFVTDDFDGTYGNIIKSKRSIEVDKKIAENKRNIEERKKRINNGTASILDKIGNALDNWGNASYQAQINSEQPDLYGHLVKTETKAKNNDPANYNQEKLQKQIGFLEGLGNGIMSGDAIPIVGGWLHGRYNQRMQTIAEKIKNGKGITQSELDDFNLYREKEYEKYIRGYTIGGKIGESFLPSLLGFGGEMALGGAVLKGIGLAGKGIAGGISLGKNLLRSGKVSKNVAKGIAYTSGQLAEGGINAAITSTVNPARLYATYQERRLNDEMKITDRGTLIFSESLESPAKSFFKSLEQIYISYFTENMGGLLASPFKAGDKAIKSVGASQFAKVMENNPALEKLIQKTSPIFSKAYEKLNNLPIKGKSVEWLKSQVKFDGFLEELGEEVLEDVLNLTAGTTNEEKTLKNYVSKIVKTPEEWAVLCGVIALQGTALSVAGNTLGDIMTNNGAEFEDIARVLMNSTESEKIDLINEAIKNGNLKINENAIQQKQIETNRIKNKFFTQNLNAGIDEETALATATVESEAIASLAKNINMSADDVHKAFNITLQSLTDEEANEQFEKDNEELKKQMFRQSVEDKNTVDLSNDFEKAPTLEEVKNYINQIIENGTKFATLSPDWFVDIKKEKSNRKQKRISDKILNNGNFLKLNRKEKDRHNKYILSLERLLNNSEYIGEKENKKKDKKPYVAKYHYFKTNVKIGNKTYQIIFDTEEYNNPQSATTSIPVVSKEHSTDSKLPTAQYVNRILKPLSEDTNSITNSDSNFNPKTVHLYNITELKPSKIHYQNIEETPKNNIEKTFGDTVENITENIKNDVMNILAENNVDESEFDFEDIQIYGSYAKGTNKATSDLDIIVQYSGSMPEDGAFNMFAEEDLSIEDLNGNNVKIDINPINSAKSGTIEENLKYFDSIDDRIHFQPAYHGTPHRFEKFSTGNIGTGEGNQAHGWGLYFAGNKEVSENYRKTLSDTNGIGTEIQVDGKTYKKIATNTYRNKENHYESIDDNFNKALNFIETKGSKKEALKYIQKQIDTNINAGFNDEAVYYIRIKDELNKIKNSKITKYADDYGQLFEVDIPEDDVLLDENKPFSKQSEKVKKSIEELFNKEFSENIKLLNDIKKHDYNGKGIYEAIREEKAFEKLGENLGGHYKNKYNDEFYKEASLLLNEYGIKGIVYDGQIDGRCYVVFDDKAINVLKKYYQEEDNIENARGFTYERKNFDGTTKDNLIVLLKGKANKSTLLHEFAHVYLTTLNNLARENDKAKDLLIKVNKYLRYNGKEYTSYQHEKFANTFVAYVKTGKAPTYGLKRVFENFKKWLNDLYTSLQLTDDFELSKEAKDLFDELLGDMTLDAQKEASLEIVRKAKNNALLKLQQEQTDKQKIPQNQLTEKQKRYRDTAYNILWYALSHTKNEEGKQLVKDKRQLYMLLANENQMNKKNKEIKLQAEKLEQVLAELDDPFSANDGFLPEWGEFFYDTGVSYDNKEVGADSELALMALDVIRNKKYLYDFENGYEELSEKDVRVAELELDYILQVYKESGAGAKHYGAETDKSNVVVAFFEWIDNQHPYIQEELIKKWELKTNEIDRYQALSKFAQAKEDLKLYAATLKGQGDYSWQFADYARAILKRLDFMTERDKEKIFDKLKEYNSFREVERNLDFVMDYAETLSDVTDRRKLADDIVSEVKQTIHEWKDGIKKTKYTYPANKLFERLRQINNMKQEEIENLYDEQVNEETQPSYVSDEVNDKDFYETIEKMFITFKYNGLYYNSTEFLTDLLNKIQSAKFTAKVARDELDFERRLQQINLIDECARAIDVHKFEDNDTKLVELAQNLNAHIMNLNGALEMIFNNKIKNQFSLDYLYAKKDGQVGKDRREVLDKLKNIFQFKNDRQLFSRIIDMTKAEYEIKQRYTPDIENGSFHTSDIYDKESGQTKATVQQILPEGLNRNEWEPEKIKLSKMEIIYYYIQSKNNISYKMLTDMGDETTSPKGQFDKFEFDQMIDSLTMQEKLMGDVLQAAAEKYYDGLNAYHIKRYHTDLGKVSCYFPRLSEVEDPKMLDVFNDYVMYNGKDSSQKHRTAYVGTRIKPANALAVLFSHIEKANTIIIMGEQLDLMNRVFNNSNLKKKIETAFGQDITQAFYQHITANLYSGQSALRSLQEQFFAKIANNAVKTQIFFKPQIGLKQLLSFMNYGKGDEYVSAGEWLKEFTKQTLTPSEWKKNIDFMLENDYLRDRYSRGGSTDALKRQLENRMFSKLSLLDELWGLPIQLGDIGAIIWGGKPYVDVLMKKGYTKEQAFKIFIETTVNDQQSSIPSTLSNAQREAKKSAFSTMMFAYQNTPYQYLRSCYTPIVKALQEGGNKNILKASKMFFIYGWLFPAIFNMASTLSVFSLFGGDDDQFKKDMQFAFLGLFGMLPIWGDTLKAIIYGLAGDNYSGGTNYFVTASNKLNKLARHIEKEKVTLADVWNAIAVIGEMLTGQPLGSMGNAVSGIYDVTQGNAAKGTLKVMGYSDYRAKTVTGEK